MSLFSYAAVQGNVRARLSQLVDHATWNRMVEANTAAEVAQMLGHTGGYRTLQALWGDIASEANSLARYVPRRSREIVNWYSRRFEIENLKTVLRAVHYRLDAWRARTSLIPLHSSRISWDRLLEAPSIAAVTEHLRNTPFAGPLDNAMERYRHEDRLFHLEIALDLFYFQKLVRMIESQSGKDAIEARRFLGRWIEMQNLLWAYRYRIYGRMTPEQIINYTLHQAFSAGLDTVRRIALGSPVTEEAARLGFPISPETPELEALTKLEVLAQRELYRSASAATRRPLFHLGGVLAYLWLLEAQVRDLTLIMEGKQTGVSGPEIAHRMIRAA